MKGKKQTGRGPLGGMPVISHAAKPSVIAAAKARKSGGKVVDMDKDGMKCGGRAPRKRGGAVMADSASKAPMACAATSTSNRKA